MKKIFALVCAPMFSLAGDIGEALDISALKEGESVGRIVILGELHGTAESPAFAKALIQAAQFRGTSVVLGIEANRDFASLINDRHLRNSCNELEATDFWNRSSNVQDGRSSAAMKDLWCWAFGESAQGRLRLLALEPQSKSAPELLLASLSQYSAGLAVALIGSYHARKSSEFGGPPSLGDKIAAKASSYQVMRYFMTYPSGTAWNCRPICGEHAVISTGRSQALTLMRFQLYSWKDLSMLDVIPPVPSGFQRYFDGIYWLGEVTASPPAMNKQ